MKQALKKKISLVGIIICLLLLVILIRLYNTQKAIIINNYPIVMKNIDKSVEIQQDTKDEYQKILDETIQEIGKFTPIVITGSTVETWANGTGEEKEIIKKTIDKPDFLLYIKKAQYERYLGRYTEALKTLFGVLIMYGDNVLVAYNNIWALYDELGEYKLAIDYYQKIIDKQLDDTLAPYYKKISRDYIMIKNVEKAEEYYILYLSLDGSPDGEYIKLIEDLKK